MRRDGSKMKSDRFGVGLPIVPGDMTSGKKSDKFKKISSIAVSQKAQIMKVFPKIGPGVSGRGVGASAPVTVAAGHAAGRGEGKGPRSFPRRLDGTGCPISHRWRIPDPQVGRVCPLLGRVLDRKTWATATCISQTGKPPRGAVGAVAVCPAQGEGEGEGEEAADRGEV